MFTQFLKEAAITAVASRWTLTTSVSLLIYLIFQTFAMLINTGFVSGAEKAADDRFISYCLTALGNPLK